LTLLIHKLGLERNSTATISLRPTEQLGILFSLCHVAQPRSCIGGESTAQLPLVTPVSQGEKMQQGNQTRLRRSTKGRETKRKAFQREFACPDSRVSTARYLY